MYDNHIIGDALIDLTLQRHIQYAQHETLDVGQDKKHHLLHIIILTLYWESLGVFSATEDPRRGELLRDEIMREMVFEFE